MTDIQKAIQKQQQEAFKEYYEKQVADIMSRSSLSREEAETAYKRAQQTMKYALMPAEKIDDICDSGAFNSIIIGYMLLILDEMKLTKQIDRAELDRAARVVFELFGAKVAREREAE